MRLRARHYCTTQPLDVVCEHGRIAHIEPAGSQPADIEAEWIAPAFCDVQINGCDGISFNAERLTQEQIGYVVAVCRKHGIAQLCPTLITGSFEARCTAHGFRTIRQTCTARRRAWLQKRSWAFIWKGRT